MSEMLTVPAAITVHLRQALLSELGGAGSEIQYGVEIKDPDLHPERIAEHVERFDRYRALLDTIGWTRPANPQPLHLDLGRHEWALLTTLEGQLSTLRDLVKIPADYSRASEQKLELEPQVRELEQFLDAIDQPAPRAEHLIMLQLLDNEHHGPWTRAELETKLNNIPPHEITTALTHLRGERVLTIESGQIRASRCARHLDRLELIAI
jgi:hypothetical protein